MSGIKTKSTGPFAFFSPLATLVSLRSPIFCFRPASLGSLFAESFSCLQKVDHVTNYCKKKKKAIVPYGEFSNKRISYFFLSTATGSAFCIRSDGFRLSCVGWDGRSRLATFSSRGSCFGVEVSTGDGGFSLFCGDFDTSLVSGSLSQLKGSLSPGTCIIR